MLLVSSSAFAKLLLKKVIYTPYICHLNSEHTSALRSPFPGNPKEITGSFGGKPQDDHMVAHSTSARWLPIRLKLVKLRSPTFQTLVTSAHKRCHLPRLVSLAIWLANSSDAILIITSRTPHTSLLHFFANETMGTWYYVEFARAFNATYESFPYLALQTIASILNPWFIIRKIVLAIFWSNKAILQVLLARILEL